MNDRNHKYDITRLKNLLRNYRASIITVRMNTLKHIEPIDIIEEVDKSIRIIIAGLK